MEQRLGMILQLFGGLAMFLYGMDCMSSALQAAVGVRMQSFLAAATRSPLRGVLTGTIVTAALQSSSAATVMVIGFVRAGLLSLPQAVAVIFGANIGTTMTAQLLAFHIEEGRYLLLVAGLCLTLVCKSSRGRAAGQTVFGTGLLFEGIALMGNAAEPLASSPVFQHWMVQVRERPLWGLLLGTAMTLTVQSSSATIGVLQSLASRPAVDGASILGLYGALPILLGDNIGTTITAVLAAVGRSRDAKRVAAAHCIFNLSGSVVFLCGLPWFVRLVQMISPKGAETAVIARQIANAHTLFNLTCALVWLPFLPQMLRLVLWLFPGVVKTNSQHDCNTKIG